MNWVDIVKEDGKMIDELEVLENMFRDDPDTFIARIVSSLDWKNPSQRLTQENLDGFRQQYAKLKPLYDEFVSSLKASGINW